MDLGPDKKILKKKSVRCAYLSWLEGGGVGVYLPWTEGTYLARGTYYLPWTSLGYPPHTPPHLDLTRIPPLRV